MVKSIKELRSELDKVMPKDYTYYIDYSYDYFRIEIDHYFVIDARVERLVDYVTCEFVLEVKEFDDYLTYNDLMLVICVIDVLNNNRDFVLSKLSEPHTDVISDEDIDETDEIEDEGVSEDDLNYLFNMFDLFKITKDSKE